MFLYCVSSQETVRKLRESPFDHKEWQVLQQHYFSPPCLMESNSHCSSSSDFTDDTNEPDAHENSRKLLDSSAPIKSDDSSTKSAGRTRPSLVQESLRPLKKASNRSTVARINYYSRIKVLMERNKALGKTHDNLAILRQLRVLEDALQDMDPNELEDLMLQEVLQLRTESI